MGANRKVETTILDHILWPPEGLSEGTYLPSCWSGGKAGYEKEQAPNLPLLDATQQHRGAIWSSTWINTVTLRNVPNTTVKI